MLFIKFFAVALIIAQARSATTRISELPDGHEKSLAAAQPPEGAQHPKLECWTSNLEERGFKGEWCNNANATLCFMSIEDVAFPFNIKKGCAGIIRKGEDRKVVRLGLDKVPEGYEFVPKDEISIFPSEDNEAKCMRASEIFNVHSTGWSCACIESLCNIWWF